MAQEFETKILNINVLEIEKKLIDLGAKKQPEVLMKRWVFVIDPNNYEWIRLRDNGHKTTITYKKKTGTAISQTEEIEVEVDDFEKTVEILSKIKFKEKYYQENKRKLFILKDIEFTIDTWPLIPTYLEIESLNEEKVKQGLSLLKLDDKDVGNLSVKDVYLKYNIDLHSYPELKFENRKKFKK